jgi:hypothetical protein
MQSILFISKIFEGNGDPTWLRYSPEIVDKIYAYVIEHWHRRHPMYEIRYSPESDPRICKPGKMYRMTDISYVFLACIVLCLKKMEEFDQLSYLCPALS